MVLVDQRAVRRVGAGVVDQDVDAAEAVEGQFDTVPRGVLVDRVGGNTDGVASNLLGRGVSASCLREVSTIFAPPSASRCAIGQPDPPRASGDDCGAALEVWCGHSPSIRLCW